MNTTDPYAWFGTKQTPQDQQIPGRPEQVENNAGGYVFPISPIVWLRRFLTIGTAGGTYYVGEKELTQEAGNKVLEFTKTPFLHTQLVDEIVKISLAGRAPKQNPTLFALAIACQHGDVEGKQYARSKITQVVRTGTHLFIFVGYLQQFGGWSRGLRKAVGAWYTEKDADALAYQVVKYRQREGWTHRDVLRLTHPKVEEPSKRTVLNWVVKGSLCEEKSGAPVPNLIHAHELVMQNPDQTARILGEIRLPWEALPDSAMNDPEVWDKLLDSGVPIGALLRQLPRLTQLDMLPQMGGRTDEIAEMLVNSETIHKSRIHPFTVLVAMKTYRQGRGVRSTWTPSAKIVDALDEMFYASFDNVVPTGKRTMNALDVSGSMTSRVGTLPLSCREISAALAMVTVRTEPNQMTVGFTDGGVNRSQKGRLQHLRRNALLTDLPLSSRQRLDDVVRSISNIPFGGTDCALPMLEASRRELEIDTFAVYTDNETWHGDTHPVQALQQYRKDSGIDAKLVVVSIIPSKFSIADPSDQGMLDISGLDSAVPTLISDFSSGVL